MDRNEHGFKLGLVKTQGRETSIIVAFTAEGEPVARKPGRRAAYVYAPDGADPLGGIPRLIPNDPPPPVVFSDAMREATLKAFREHVGITDTAVLLAAEAAIRVMREEEAQR